MIEPSVAYAAETELLRVVQLGIEAAHFINKEPMGKHLMQRAVEMRADALEELATAPAYDAHKILDLQYKAKIPDLFIAWLNEATALGKEAEEEADFLDRQDGYK